MMGKSVGRLAFAAFSLVASGLSVRADANVLEGYTPLEYIESTGVQWVNTGVPGNTVFGLKAGIIVTGVKGSWQSLIGATKDNFTIGTQNNNQNACYLRYRTTEVYNNAETVFSPSTRNDIVLMNGKFTIDGVDAVLKNQIPSGALDTTDKALSICNNTSSSAPSNLKVYYLQLYTSRGALMANLFPVKSTSGDQIGLYDLERKQFCGNAGGGVFTAGPESTSWRLAADGSLETLATIAAPSDFGYTVNGTAYTGPAEVWLKAGEPATLVANGSRNFRWTKKPAGAEMSGASSTWTPTAPENMAFEAVPTYYVRTGGNDQNNGLTPQTALATFQAGFDKMNASTGNALDLGEGTFTCDAQLTVKSGSTILGAGPGKTTLVFGNGDYRLNLSNASAEIPTALRNLTFTSGASHQGVVVWGANYYEIENCIFENIIANGSDKGVVYFCGNSPRMSHVIIRNCRAGSMTGGICLYANSGVIENCLFYDNTIGTDSASSGANGYWSANAVTLNNCTFGRSTMALAPSFREGDQNCKLNNCLFYSKNSSTAVEENCLVWGVGDYATKWVNYESGNYRLTAAATDAIDQGQAITTVKDDLAGVKRPQGAAYDIGCYEFPRAKKGIVFIFHGR